MRLKQIIREQLEMLIHLQKLCIIKMFLMGDPGDFMDVLPANYPFLFLSLMVTISVIIFILSKTFAGREKIILILSLIGAILSTGFYYFDKAWQVFDDPNWFFHRHAFVFLPIFLVITLRVFEHLKDVPFKDIRNAGLIVSLGLVITYALGRYKNEDKIFIYNLIFIIVYCVFAAAYGVKNWPEQFRDIPKIISPMLAILMGFELVFAGPMISSGIESFTMF